MAVTLAQAAKTSFGNIWVTDGIEALAFDGAAANGSLIVVAIRYPDSPTVASVDDDGTTTYSEIRLQEDDGISCTGVIYAGIAAGSPTTVTVTLSAADAAQNMLLGILNFAGNDSDLTSVPNNGTTYGVATQNHAAGSVTPDTANNVLVGLMVGTNGAYTQDANYTDVLSNTRLSFGYRIQASATASNFTPTSAATENSVSMAAAFRGTADAGGGAPRANLPLLGVS